MSLDPLKIYEKIDPDLHGNISKAIEFALSDGALPKKFKLLIAMVLDASHGAVPGVIALAKAAKAAGATKEEILEAIRVAHYISGVGCVYAASHAMKELFE
ncbi:MAG: carboxymuconolactone decarboxylase family protein [Candidatus Lokiarchaeota archaeon]|nr:carboxymuconolactone decarboxylase family protein [Candidatus Lokiarchaeota archaeon]